MGLVASFQVGRIAVHPTNPDIVYVGALGRLWGPNPERGLYVLADARPTERHSLAEACKRVPHGVVCLLSALQFHGLTTQAPFEVWMGPACARLLTWTPLT